MNAEVRTSIDHLLDDRKARLAEPGTSLLPLLTVMSRFVKYSLANQYLIFTQRPGATRVLGYRGWQKAGYQVRKGEHGIAIYAPMHFTSRETAESLNDENNAAPRLGFRVAYVFDVTQVDPLAGTVVDNPVATASSPDAHRATEQLKALLFGHNVELEYRAMQPGLLGYTDGRRTSSSRRWPTRPRTCCCTSPGMLMATRARAPTSPRARPTRFGSTFRSRRRPCSGPPRQPDPKRHHCGACDRRA